LYLIDAIAAAVEASPQLLLTTLRECLRDVYRPSLANLLRDPANKKYRSLRVSNNYVKKCLSLDTVAVPCCNNNIRTSSCGGGGVVHIGSTLFSWIGFSRLGVKKEEEKNGTAICAGEEEEYHDAHHNHACADR